MKTIVDGQYWGDPAKIKDGSFAFGTNDTKPARRSTSTSSPKRTPTPTRTTR